MLWQRPQLRPIPQEMMLDLDPEAVHFLFKGKWVEWDARGPGGGAAYPAPHGILDAPT